MKYCPYCGADIPDGAVSFCAECGKALPVKKEKPEKSTPVKKSSAGKKKKHKSTVMTDAELRKAYNDGYDGYYEDLLPVDHGRERFVCSGKKDHHPGSRCARCDRALRTDAVFCLIVVNPVRRPCNVSKKHARWQR